MKAFIFNFHGISIDNEPQFGCFSFEDKDNVKKSTNLYMIGKLNNPSPKDESFLKKLAFNIKNCYQHTKNKSPESALNGCLGAINSFFENSARENNVSWLGNLSFAVFALRNRDFYFSVTGGISVFLLRQGAVIDLTKELKNVDVASGQVFGSLISGKLNEFDAILASTPALDENFKKKHIIQTIARILEPPAKNFNERQLVEIFDSYKAKMPSFFGSSLLIWIRGDLEGATVKELYAADALKTVAIRSLFDAEKSDSKKILSVLSTSKSIMQWKKFLIVGAALLIILFCTKAGLFAYQKQQLKSINIRLDAISASITAAEQMKSNNNTSSAENILKSSADKLAEIKKSLVVNLPGIAQRISQLETEIESANAVLNNLITVQPSVIYQFHNFSPENIAVFGNNIAACGSNSKGIYIINTINKTAKFIPSEYFFNNTAAQNDKVLFFSPPDVVAIFQNDSLKPLVKIKLPYSNSFLENFSVFADNLYFIDHQNKIILKYAPNQNGYSLPQLWLKDNLKIKDGAVLMAAGRSLWILNQNGTIDEYFLGKLKQTIAPQYKTPLQKPVSLAVAENMKNFYILDSGTGRIIIFSKDGQIVKQLTSNQFVDANDMSVGKDEKEIYILNKNQLMIISLQ